MKRLLVGILSIIPVLSIPVIGLTAQGQLISSDAEYFTKENTPVNGELNKLIIEGIPPYKFETQHAMHGSVKANQAGSFLFTLNPGLKNGSFDYVVTDANGNTDEGIVSIIVE